MSSTTGCTSQQKEPVVVDVRVPVEMPMSLRSDANALFEEAFRTLRSNVLLRVQEGEKAFLVTSAGPGEGKSTIAANLAHVLVASRRKVLLADADLRRPRLHDLFGIPNQRGLTDLLRGVSPPNAVYQRVGSGLTVLTSGLLPRDPQELFLGGSLASVMGILKNDFDVVLFDSAPVLAFEDTTLLANTVDGVILVLKSGKVTTAEARMVRKRLQSAHARLVGCVLTCVPSLYLQPYHPYNGQYTGETEPESKPVPRSIVELTWTLGPKL